VNDGIQGPDHNKREDRNTYLDSCTRFCISNPSPVARCTLPTIANLRHLARGTHFVASNGEVVRFPKQCRAKAPPRIVISNTQDMDKVCETENSRLRDFLKRVGLEVN
jgi:hypothetical protein